MSNLQTNVPPEVEIARANASKAGADLASVAGAEPMIADVLRQKIIEAYNSNQDITIPLDKATTTYLGAPQAAREKYQDIFNPFQRENLVSQYQGNAALPMLSLSNIFGSRVGSQADTINAGASAYGGIVAGKKANYDALRSLYGDLYSEYVGGQQLQGDEADRQLAREKFEYDKTHSGSGGGGTAGERLEPTVQSAINDARVGWTLADMQLKYGAKLGQDGVVQIYTANSPNGEPNEPYARKIMGLPEFKAQDEENVPWYQKVLNFAGIN